MPTDVHTAPEIAIRLSKAFGSTAKHWNRMQANHDLAVAEQRADQIKVELCPKAA